MFAKNYSTFYELLNQDKPYEQEIRFIYDWANKPKSIFDIGCGTGNYWKFYPKKTRIVGIDQSRHMAHGLKNIICADIRKYKHKGRFDCATALFDVLNYIPNNTWWKNIPLKKGGYFIFDIWDTKKIEQDGFKKTTKLIDHTTRHITPIRVEPKSVDLQIDVLIGNRDFEEIHTLYLHSYADILAACASNGFEVVGVRSTKKWQTWYKCVKK